MLKKNLLYVFSGVCQRDENFALPEYEFRCCVLSIPPLWRRRVNCTVLLIYDILHGIIESNSLRNWINYTRLQYGASQRVDYARNQPV